MKTKHILYTLLLTLTIFSCGTNNQENSKKSGETGTNELKSVKLNDAKTVVELLEIADEKVDKEVVVTGLVTHVCRHSGKRCFLMDDNGKTSIRLEAGGNINGFNQELSGSKLVAKGILRENRLSSSYIDEWEEKTLEKKEKAEIDENACSSELNNIKEMRKWMKENNKDYYAVYYIEGIDYEEIE
ncbi:MAG: hypothetical protein PWQ17_2252 [Anaerophaga sp.]|nr:hypothetical protein [Anaerophaga sp.]MDN5290316.1 hypothetical protein [Anaerophaga sp.]